MSKAESGVEQLGQLAAILPTLCAIARRDLGLFVFVVPMPPRHAKGSRVMTTIITFIVFACGLGAMGALAFETPDIRDRDE